MTDLIKAAAGVAASDFQVIVGHESSGAIRNALRSRGINAWSCDLQPADDGSPYHFQCDIRDVALAYPWRWGMFHPDCTYLTVPAAWALKDPDYDRFPGVGYHQKVRPGTPTGAKRRALQVKAIEHVKWLLELPYPKAIENPAISALNKAIRPPDQKIHPYQFGDDASKLTGLWLDRMPPLVPTKYVEPRMVCKCGHTFQESLGAYGCPNCLGESGKALPRWDNQTDSGQNNLSPSDDRWKVRSKTYPGIANAVGDQWGHLHMPSE